MQFNWYKQELGNSKQILKKLGCGTDLGKLGHVLKSSLKQVTLWKLSLKKPLIYLGFAFDIIFLWMISWLFNICYIYLYICSIIDKKLFLYVSINYLKHIKRQSIIKFYNLKTKN